MKKFLAIFMALCLVMSAFSLSAFAARSAFALENFDTAVPIGVKLRVSALMKKGTTEAMGDYHVFEDGWNFAMGRAEDEDYLEDNNIDRIVVDLFEDWTANADGEFGDGDGFSYDTILIPADARVTLNLNGYTINRGLTSKANNGEVICIGDDADVIINNGTIKGGRSTYSAGGIYVKDDVKITLNNVHFTENYTEWNGGAIAINDGSSLVMNGGSFEHNGLVNYENPFADAYGGAAYVEDATAAFNNVEFKNNYAPHTTNFGAAIFADTSKVTIKDCVFDGNGVKETDRYVAESIIHAIDSTIKVEGTTFTGNGGQYKGTTGMCDYSALFVLDCSKLIVDTSEIIGNLSYFIFNDEDESEVKVSNTRFIDNQSAILRGDSDSSSDSYFEDCLFENNGTYENVSFYQIKTFLTFYNCSMGNTEFADMKFIKFVENFPDAEALLSLSALKKDGTTEFIANYNSFENGWNAAMALAIDSATMQAKGYDRVVVDLHTNWNAKDKQFTEKFNNGVGFDWDAILIQPSTRVTLNLNGFTIDRGMTGSEENGEVICISNGADVIINDGTISGGWSRNGAGGIHIHDDSNVTLNNVNFIGNNTTSDDGAAIAVYDDSILTVNGGIFEGNFLMTGLGATSFDGIVYVEDSVAYFNNVIFRKNGTDLGDNVGVAIRAKDSSVVITECTFDGNGVVFEGTEYDQAHSTLSFVNSDATVKDCTFTDDYSQYTVHMNDSTVNIDNCLFTNNHSSWLLSRLGSTEFTITNTKFIDNFSRVFYDNYFTNDDCIFINCTFNNNSIGTEAYDFSLENGVTFEDCDLGDSNFYSSDNVTLINTPAPACFADLEASIFGEGSVSITISFLALVASAASIGLCFAFNKKRTTEQTK